MSARFQHVSISQLLGLGVIWLITNITGWLSSMYAHCLGSAPFWMPADDVHPVWPYCAAARRLSSIVMSEDNARGWSQLEWRRRLETFGEDDGPVIGSGSKGEVDSVWCGRLHSSR